VANNGKDQKALNGMPNKSSLSPLMACDLESISTSKLVNFRGEGVRTVVARDGNGVGRGRGA